MEKEKSIWKTIKSDKLLFFSFIIAIVFIATGLLFFFGNLFNFLFISNSEFVTAFFTLTGVILYFSALIYQIKEYRLQIDEMRKSVEAQTKSSEALDKQNKILLEQNDKQLILTNINYFNEFKFRNNIDEMMKALVNEYRILFYDVINFIIKNQLRAT